MITPISLESDREIIKSQVTKAKELGAKRFHADIIDGNYVDNITVAPADLQGITFDPLNLEIHLLVDDPTEWIEECVALSPKRLIAQVEHMGSIEHYVEAVESYGGVEIGLGLGINTPIDALTEEVLGKVDLVLLLAVEAGFSGTPFDARVIPKIRELRTRYQGVIFVDGGIDPKHFQEVLAAGASEAGANSAIWKGDYRENWNKFMELVDNG